MIGIDLSAYVKVSVIRGYKRKIYPHGEQAKLKFSGRALLKFLCRRKIRIHPNITFGF